MATVYPMTDALSAGRHSSPWPSFAALVRRDGAPGAAQEDRGIGIVSILTAIDVALVVFGIQFALFVLLRNRLARIFKPKSYLVPERERTKSPPRNILALARTLFKYSDREVIEKCGLDAYFFLRYLKTLLVIFIPICLVVMPILIPINYINGRGQSIRAPRDRFSDSKEWNSTEVTGLDTLAWGNVSAKNTARYGAHLFLAIVVIIWVCAVFFLELRVYIKVRQDYLTSAEHRLRASATTVLVNSIPHKWLSEEALLGLFDVFPGGVRNVWLNRDLSPLLDKIALRSRVHARLEAAETALIRSAKRSSMRQCELEEKKRRKEQHIEPPTREERAVRDAIEDAEATRMANSGLGTDAGNQHQVPHSIAAGVRESRVMDLAARTYPDAEMEPDSGVGDGTSETRDTGANDQVRESDGEYARDHDGVLSGDSVVDDLDGAAQEQANPESSTSGPQRQPAGHLRGLSTTSAGTVNTSGRPGRPVLPGNTIRELSSVEDLYMQGRTRFWQFWKPPAGGYIYPVPQGHGLHLMKRSQASNSTSLWQKMKKWLPFTGDRTSTRDYPLAHNPNMKEDEDEGAEWAKYLTKGDRPTHHLGVGWLPGLPIFGKKVDSIYWCRRELARLNLEIEEDQKHPERFPLMRSAFVQFNHQVAAHMACQSVIYHMPREMSPRMNEISPKDVVWGNMALSWWEEWLRTAVVLAIVASMIFLWAVPVAWTAALSQLDDLIRKANFFGYLRRHQFAGNLAKAVAGVLPAAALGILLFLIPLILTFLAGLKGAKTGAQKTEFVQIFYFVFLFIQVFLVVSIASFFAASLNEFLNNLKNINRVSDVLNLLATNLPKAANYFFSYMILQALSTSSGVLLQIGSLFICFIVAPLLDQTPRSKWSRNTTLNQINWGSYFPVYTNFACIGLIYCVIAPLISLFAIITFSLLWLAHRYAMLYVIRFENDTGGVLYPRAINQTFTGIYFMELCMAGLFFIAVDSNGNRSCTTHGIVMIIVLFLTVAYQVLLNLSFSPLFRYLPITFEDEAALRDEAFQRAQDIRLGLVSEGEVRGEEEKSGRETVQERAGASTGRVSGQGDGQDVELGQMKADSRAQGLQLRAHVKQVGSWAKDGGKQMGTWAKGGGKQVGAWARDGGNQLRKLTMLSDGGEGAEYRRRRRKQDIESQRAWGAALYGGVHDDIQDLTPEERDALTRHAFQHYALRARRPTVWIPRDDLGVSDDEIRRTNAYTENIWISNEGTALDSKARVVYGKSPPDFSELDVINL